MSRTTTAPDVAISANITTDSKTGSNAANIIIDVSVEGYSNGFVVLDEPGDLYILRKAIDDFITRNNIKNPFQYED